MERSQAPQRIAQTGHRSCRQRSYAPQREQLAKQKRLFQETCLGACLALDQFVSGHVELRAIPERGLAVFQSAPARQYWALGNHKELDGVPHVVVRQFAGHLLSGSCHQRLISMALQNALDELTYRIVYSRRLTQWPILATRRCSSLSCRLECCRTTNGERKDEKRCPHGSLPTRLRRGRSSVFQNAPDRGEPETCSLTGSLGCEK